MSRFFNTFLVILALASPTAHGFTPSSFSENKRSLSSKTSLSSSFIAPFFSGFLTPKEEPVVDLTPRPPATMPPSELLYADFTMLPQPQEETKLLFAPLVQFGKQILGDQELNRIRGNVIAQHSSMIQRFVGTAESKFGNMVLRALFQAADTNGNGRIEMEELEAALQTVGFRHLNEKQIKGIFQRAQQQGSAADGNDEQQEKNFITLDEWMEAAPKTLKTNLVKLAKTNGGELGFLV